MYAVQIVPIVWTASARSVMIHTLSLKMENVLNSVQIRSITMRKLVLVGSVQMDVTRALVRTVVLSVGSNGISLLASVRLVMISVEYAQDPMTVSARRVMKIST